MTIRNNSLMWLLVPIALSSVGCGSSSEKTEPSAKQDTVAVDPLPSWNESASKKSIIDFVTKTTKQDSPAFIPVSDRIACFDNDGTLWSEQPMYFQLAFAIDRVKAMASQHPEWKRTQPFQGVLEGELNH